MENTQTWLQLKTLLENFEGNLEVVRTIEANEKAYCTVATLNEISESIEDTGSPPDANTQTWADLLNLLNGLGTNELSKVREVLIGGEVFNSIAQTVDEGGATSVKDKGSRPPQA